MNARTIFLFALPLAIGCSSSTTTTNTTDAGNDSATPTDSGGTDAAVGPKQINGCTTFEDHTASGDARTLTWNLAIASSPSRCMMVKVGQSVTWDGDFGVHPLTTAGGDSPNPISTVDATSKKVTFTAVGTFGYVCGVHPSMTGAIFVEP